ncbi:MAG: NlpC/P60 family protein [Eubacteriales bacterium]|nr:NlpC/P60 family protein [Eubacteriales bacterium]
MRSKPMLFLAGMFAGLLLCTAPALAQSDTATIKATTVYLRAEPTLLSERCVQVPAGVQVSILDSAGEWSKIQYEGRVGWIPASALLDAQPDAAPAETKEALPASQLLNPDNQQTVTGLQQLLQYLGYYQGEINGIYDETLREAVIDYQKADGRDETGQVDQETLNSMLLEKELLEDIVNTALAQLGVRYRYAHASPKSGFDCSGLIYYVYGQNGYKLNRTARGQLSDGVAVKRENIRPGDIIVFAGATHVGMYVGDNAYIHAPYTGEVVKIQTFTRKYSGIRRVVGGAP